MNSVETDLVLPLKLGSGGSEWGDFGGSGRSFEETDWGDVDESENAESIVTVEVVLTFERVFTRSEGGGIAGCKAAVDGPTITAVDSIVVSIALIIGPE